jgi:trigger factor
LLEGLDEALDGLSAGEVTTFDSPLRAGSHEGANGLVTVTVEAVKERELPAVDDEFAELASSFDTVEELRDGIRAEIAESKIDLQVVQAQEKLIDHLLDTLDFPAPEGVVQAEAAKILAARGQAPAAPPEDDAAQVDDAAQPAPATPADGGEAPDADAPADSAAAEPAEEAKEGDQAAEPDADAAKATAEATVEATRAVRTQLLLDALAQHLEVTAGDGELANFLYSTARRYGVDPDAFIRATMRNDEMPHFYAELVRGKAGLLAATQVSVKDSAGNAVDIKARVAPPEAAGGAADDAAVVGPADALDDAELAADALVDEVAIDLDGLIDGIEDGEGAGDEDQGDLEAG